jgi:exonuclease III
MLNTPTEHDFQDAFKKWQKRWQQCIRAKGDYSRLMVASMPKVNFYQMESTSPVNYGYQWYEELEHVFHKCLKYHMKILLGDFNAKVGREDIFKSIIGNASLHKISNDNGVTVVSFVPSKYLSVKSTMFPHRTIHKFTWTSPDVKTHNQSDHILIDRRLH